MCLENEQGIIGSEKSIRFEKETSHSFTICWMILATPFSDGDNTLCLQDESQVRWRL